jgi:cell division protein FtsB
VTTEAPVFFSAPEDLIVNPVMAETQCGWANNLGPEPTFVPSFSAGLPPKPPTLAVKQEQGGDNSGASSPSFEMYGDSGHSTDGDDKSQLRKEKSKGKGKASVDQLPKELANHPCAATLLSAGIRIKGRSQDELIQVAERIKKRRRASAARCRARRASHIHVLEDENEELKEENAALKRRIAELTGGNMDLAKLLGTDAASLQAIPDLEQCAY